MDYLYKLLELLKLKNVESPKFEKPNGYKSIQSSSYNKN